MARIVLENIVKKYGKVLAVNNVSLTVPDKEFIVLLGPSGCGKTTILKTIAGLERPDSGNIYIGDEIVNEKPPEKRDVAMVFQSYALYPYMTGFDNIAFPLRVRKMPKPEIEQTVRMVAEKLGITSLLDRKPYQMSGGEMQRVAVARAMVRKPRVFLLDEPLSNLDAKLRLSARTELKKLHEELGTTFVYVTHDQVEALVLADKVALMNNGEIQQFDTPENLYDRPTSTFVAAFVGSPSTNLLQCSLRDKDGSAFLEGEGFELAISPGLRQKIGSSTSRRELILGIRPENFHLSRERPEACSIEAEVYLVESVGSEVIVDLRVAHEILKAKLPSRFKASEGEKLWISFNEDDMHIFDREREKRLF